MAPTSRAAVVEVEADGRRLQLSNLDKVLYPQTDFTKGDLLDYYRRVAPVLLPWLAGRPVTFRRFPEGVDGFSFYEKHLPRGAPSWVRTVLVPRRPPRADDPAPAIDSLPALMWAANLAVIEFHVPMWRVDAAGAPERPDLLVFDLDPGAPAGLGECATVALALRERLRADGYAPLPKTSGSKGLQLYVPRPVERRDEQPSAYARALAEELAAARDSGVVATMRKDRRAGKVLIDWSQNSPAKTTVAPYSLRARPRPGVSTPLSWEEVADLAEGDDPGLLALGPDDVLARLAARGDLFSPLLAPT